RCACWLTAAAISPARSGSSSTSPRMVSAPARSGIRCWWRTASLSRLMSSSRRAKSKARALKRCCGHFRRGSAAALPAGQRGGLLSPALFGDAGPRDSVGPFVFGVAGMAAHPFPSDDVARRSGVEPLPQIDILDRLLVGRQPVAPLPAVYPFGYA